MPTALFISPHLDDVAFSCGGTLILLVQNEWRVVLCTMFTRSVRNPQGFALACQTDKGIPPDVDYMALRRAEDEQFAKIAGVHTLLHLPHAEAPHRGYHSAPDLFGGMHADDQIWKQLVGDLRRLNDEYAPDLIFAPQGLGNHVDHLQVILAILAAELRDRICWYRDTPYIIRQPTAMPSLLMPDGLHEQGVAIDQAIEGKIEGCCAYTTQIGFQFGGAAAVAHKLRALHQREAERVHMTGYTEVFSVPPSVRLPKADSTFRKYLLQEHGAQHD
jgi:LmbE family N-acetylglucosaminyl deacetylase